MNLQNKAILDQHEHFYTTFERSQTITGLTANVKDELLRVMREEFWPGYTYDQWCHHCVGKFLTDVYNKYNEWKAKNVESVEDKTKVKIKATFPKNKLQ